MHAYVAEFIGTAILILLGDGVVANGVATAQAIGTKGLAFDGNKFNWIGVSFLEDLIASDEIIPARLKDSILKAQAKAAGRPS